MPYLVLSTAGVVLGILAKCRGYVRVPLRDLNGLQHARAPNVEISKGNRQLFLIAPQAQAEIVVAAVQAQFQPDPVILLTPVIPSDVVAPSHPTFTLFSQLPAEIRAKVWKYALPGPRIVKYKSNGAKVDMPLLIVCNESRHEVLRSYKTLFGPLDYKVYIDPQIDTLYVNELHFFTEKINNRVHPSILENLKHVVYPLNKLEDLIQWPNYIIRERLGRRLFNMRCARHLIEHLLDFTGLELLTLVDSVVDDAEADFKLVELFTKPFHEWPVRTRAAYTGEERRALSTPAYLGWKGTFYWPEELKKFYDDTNKAVWEMLEWDEQEFKVEVKGLTEPVSS